MCLCQVFSVSNNTTLGNYTMLSKAIVFRFLLSFSDKLTQTLQNERGLCGILIFFRVRWKSDLLLYFVRSSGATNRQWASARLVDSRQKTQYQVKCQRCQKCSQELSGAGRGCGHWEGFLRRALPRGSAAQECVCTVAAAKRLWAQLTAGGGRGAKKKNSRESETVSWGAQILFASRQS